MHKMLGFLAVLAVLICVSSPVVADDGCRCKRVHIVGHVTKTVVVRVPAAILETGGDAVRTVGGTVGTACDNAAGWWKRTGDRAFGSLRCRGR